MDIAILNVEKLFKKFEELSGINYMPVIRRGTRLIQVEAKTNAPRDMRRPPRDLSQKVTGNLRNSIKVDYNEEKQEGYVFTNLEYASYQEYGTINIPARPFMLPAFNSKVKEIKQDFKDYTKQKLSEVTD